GHSLKTRSASVATGPRSCSQLSNTNKSSLDCKYSAMLSTNDLPGRCDTPNAVATTWLIVSSSDATASSQSHAPSRNRGSTSDATCRAKRVLPTPPVPVTVTIRQSSNACAIPASSSSRPTNDVNCTGSFPGNA